MTRRDPCAASSSLGSRRPSRSRRAQCLALGALATLGTIAAFLCPPETALAASVQSVTVGPSSCIATWTLPSTGVATFSVWNRTDVATVAELTNARNGDVIGDLRNLGPGTHRPVGVRLARGPYRWLCRYDRAGTRTSSTRSVTIGVSNGTATPQFVPTTAQEMAGPLAKYNGYVESQLGVFQGEVAALSSDINSGNLAAAKTDWLKAELTWDTIGALYGNIGKLQDDINGTAAGHPAGTATPTWNGLHRVEYLLWGGQPAAAIEPYMNNLTQFVGDLIVLWDTTHPLTANLMSTRAHEMLEDAQRDVMSGNDNYGSGTSLEQVAADIQGDKVILNDLAHLLDQRDPKLVTAADKGLQSLTSALNATKVATQWVPLTHDHPEPT